MKRYFLVFWTILLLAVAARVFIKLTHAHEKWQLSQVSGHLPDLKFSLKDDKGKQVTEQDYHGDVVMLYFGFTHCPDECPTTMARFSQILKQLGNDADVMRILFITVDPKNDTPEVLHKYLSSFDPVHMIGLAGSNNDIETLAKRYRAAYRQASEAGEVQHSNVVYIFDKNGHARLLATPEDSDEEIINDLRKLSHE